jgi:hypothetical protein
MIPTFKQRFEDYKSSISGLDSLPEESFIFWSKNYNNPSSSFNPFNFLSGKVYSFEYNDVLEKGKSFINKRPVIFFTEYDNYERKNLFKGIDLILIPPSSRMDFFTRIQSVYQDQIERNLQKEKNGEGRDQSPLKTDYQTLDIVLRGMSYKHAYRSWDLKKVRGVTEIPFEEWTRIIYLDTRSIEGTQLSDIYNKNLKI